MANEPANQTRGYLSVFLTLLKSLNVVMFEYWLSCLVL